MGRWIACQAPGKPVEENLQGIRPEEENSLDGFSYWI